MVCAGGVEWCVVVRCGVVWWWCVCGVCGGEGGGGGVTPPLLRRKGSAIFSVSLALDALDPE